MSSNEIKVVKMGKLLCCFLEFLMIVQDMADLIRQMAELFNKLLAFLFRQVMEP